MKKFISFIVVLYVFGYSQRFEPTSSPGDFFILPEKYMELPKQNREHKEYLGKFVNGYNNYVLQAIDIVQGSAPDGGGYFVGIKAVPPESPIGYDLCLFDRPLLKAPRTTSYCSGSSYTVFIETMNLIFGEKLKEVPDSLYEALRMQEPDGSRREDLNKFWGNWNADGYGNHFALVQYSGIGKVIPQEEAMPGDFLNIQWKSGLGHSVVFLGWYTDNSGKKSLLYFSSQKGTNGLSDQIADLDKIKDYLFVRLTEPERIFNYDPKTKVINKNIPYEKVKF